LVGKAIISQKLKNLKIAAESSQAKVANKEHPPPPPKKKKNYIYIYTLLVLGSAN